MFINIQNNRLFGKIVNKTEVTAEQLQINRVFL